MESPTPPAPRPGDGESAPEPRVARRPFVASDPERDSNSPFDRLPEFEDEPPGSYLRELGVRGWNVGWSAVNLVLTLAVALFWAIGTLTPESPWWTLGKLIWRLLPASCVVLILVTWWQAVVGSRQAPARRTVSYLLSSLALGAWIRLHYWDGITFADPD